ncbi:hypothetical protein Gorai_024710, partial [Gossypium raimondii]|nr:hypothetical protein [Gossypium raimondii]
MYCIGFDKLWRFYVDYYGEQSLWLEAFGSSC